MTDNERPINTNRTFKEECDISPGVLKDSIEHVCQENIKSEEINVDRMENKKSTIL